MTMGFKTNGKVLKLALITTNVVQVEKFLNRHWEVEMLYILRYHINWLGNLTYRIFTE